MKKDIFCGTLEKLCEYLPSKDEVIIPGDANAQIGIQPYLSEVTKNRRGTIDKETNDNGHRLCHASNDIILTTKFDHPNKKHKVGNLETPVGHNRKPNRSQQTTI